MTPEQTRKQLVQDGADPFMIASLALEQNARLRQRIEQLTTQLKKMEKLPTRV